MQPAEAPRAPIGAYGLRLENVERARPLLVSARASWPALEIRRRIGHSDLEVDRLNEKAASLRLVSGGQIDLDRGRRRATFLLPRRLRTAELVHPLLSPAAAVMSYWLDREAFHAGAFVAGGKAWSVLGERGAGKSTTVAKLALEGVPVVCDDLLVVENGQAFAGPRSVDLRGEASRRLGVGEPLGVVGARERWRLPIGPLPNVLPLGGWLFLAWGDSVEAVPLSVHDRVLRLSASRAVRVPPRDPAALLDLAALPAWELRRPKRWSSLGDAVECLLETAA
jgi:hypothetical protein